MADAFATGVAFEPLAFGSAALAGGVFGVAFGAPAGLALAFLLEGGTSSFAVADFAAGLAAAGAAACGAGGAPAPTEAVGVDLVICFVFGAVFAFCPGSDFGTTVATGVAAAGTTGACAVWSAVAFGAFPLGVLVFAAAAFAAGFFAAAVGSISSAVVPVIRPAATCVSGAVESGAGIIGVSTAGFSARAPLAARLFARRDALPALALTGGIVGVPTSVALAAATDTATTGSVA